MLVVEIIVSLNCEQPCMQGLNYFIRMTIKNISSAAVTGRHELVVLVSVSKRVKYHVHVFYFCGPAGSKCF